MKRIEESHLIEAKYFFKDKVTGVLGQYSTNSHGKAIVGMQLSDKYDGSISLSSYQEALSARDLLNKMLRKTRGRWYQKRKKDEYKAE